MASCSRRRLASAELRGARPHPGLELAVELHELLVLLLEVLEEQAVLAGQPELGEQARHGEPQVVLVPGLGDEAVEAGPVDGLHHRVEAGLAGEQDLRRVGVAAVHLLEELDALHARHDLVGDHHRHVLGVLLELLDQLERLLAAARQIDLALVPEAAELLAQRREDALLVVDADDVIARPRVDRRGLASGLHSASCPRLPARAARPRAARPRAAVRPGAAAP